MTTTSLDQFKALNDRHGHAAGDALLKEFAHRLERSADGDAMAARLGGDEFALFIFVSDRAQLEDRITRLQFALTGSYSLDGESHLCRASIGVAVHPGHGSDADTLYCNADLALYEAKKDHAGLCYFESRMRDGLQTRLSQLCTARHALDQDLVVPFYQPKVDLETGAITGFEALLRWENQAHGLQLPGSIPAAFEDAELAVALDERIFEKLATDMTGWLASDVPFGRVAFNISSAEYRREGFVDRLLARIRQHGIPASMLELEVTETVFLGRTPAKVMAIFERLRAEGLTIALDDFGTGYASLMHLKQFPVDVIKIDRSFVQALYDPINAAIVRAIVGLGRDIGITTVAEGVETHDQARALHRKGCRVGQGFLFSPAVPAAEVPALLSSATSRWQPAERRSGGERRARIDECRLPS